MARGAKTGGRQKGTPNRATAARAAEVEASGLTPLDYLLSVMRDAGADEGVRLEAAKAAAPYIHPKLASIDLKATANVTHRDVSDEPLTTDEWADKYVTAH